MWYFSHNGFFLQGWTSLSWQWLSNRVHQWPVLYLRLFIILNRNKVPSYYRMMHTVSSIAKNTSLGMWCVIQVYVLDCINLVVCLFVSVVHPFKHNYMYLVCKKLFLNIKTLTNLANWCSCYLLMQRNINWCCGVWYSDSGIKFYGYIILLFFWFGPV